MAEMDVDREIQRVTEQVDQAAGQARERFARTGRVTGKAESADGAIAVEVVPGGLPVGVTLTPAALRGSPEVIAQQIVELAHRATRRAGDRMYHTLAPVLGPNGERHLASLGYEPIPEDDEDAPPLPGYQGR